MAYNKRHQTIVDAMTKIVEKNLSGRATLEELSAETGLSVNGLSQTLGVMAEFRWRKGQGKKAEYEFVRK